jgi:hypothetical protein
VLGLWYVFVDLTSFLRAARVGTGRSGDLDRCRGLRSSIHKGILKSETLNDNVFLDVERSGLQVEFDAEYLLFTVRENQILSQWARYLPGDVLGCTLLIG